MMISGERCPGPRFLPLRKIVKVLHFYYIKLKYLVKWIIIKTLLSNYLLKQICCESESLLNKIIKKRDKIIEIIAL